MIGQFLGAHLTTEAMWMPISRHSFDHASDNEFTAFITAWGEQHVKISLAVLSALEFVENAVLEGTEALGAPKRI